MPRRPTDDQSSYQHLRRFFRRGARTNHRFVPSAPMPLPLPRRSRGSDGGEDAIDTSARGKRWFVPTVAIMLVVAAGLGNQFLGGEALSWHSPTTGQPPRSATPPPFSLRGGWRDIGVHALPINSVTLGVPPARDAADARAVRPEATDDVAEAFGAVDVRAGSDLRNELPLPIPNRPAVEVETRAELEQSGPVRKEAILATAGTPEATPVSFETATSGGAAAMAAEPAAAALEVADLPMLALLAGSSLISETGNQGEGRSATSETKSETTAEAGTAAPPVREPVRVPAHDVVRPMTFLEMAREAAPPSPRKKPAWIEGVADPAAPPLPVRRPKTITEAWERQRREADAAEQLVERKQAEARARQQAATPKPVVIKAAPAPEANVVPRSSPFQNAERAAP